MTARRIPARPTGRPDPPLCLSAHLEAGWDAETHVETPGGPDQHFACQPASSRAKPLQVHPGPPSAAPSHRFPCPARPSPSRHAETRPGPRGVPNHEKVSRGHLAGVPTHRKPLRATRRAAATYACVGMPTRPRHARICPNPPRVPRQRNVSRHAPCPDMRRAVPRRPVSRHGGMCVGPAGVSNRGKPIEFTKTVPARTNPRRYGGSDLLKGTRLASLEAVT